jgi:uncharacterized protein (DUF1501 family)
MTASLIGRPIGRRAALLGLTAAWTMGRVSLALADAATDQRFVVVILRGALDGMSAIVPYGDPALARWRPRLIPEAVGAEGGMLDLGGFYGLHPALAGLHDMYAAGQLLPIHAVAGHYRSRSHFEAQDYMESGADHRMTSGWLNRVVSVLPAGLRNAASGGAALSVGLSMPLLLRGPEAVGSWAPSSGARPSDDLYARIAALNAGDRTVGPALREALLARGFSAEVLASTPNPQQHGPSGDALSKPDAFAVLARTCGTLLAAPNGPRVAALEIGGWDTHVQQAPRLHQPLWELSNGLVALKDGLGPAWNHTVVLVMTEFGRTARMNGDAGTDHGTGTVAFVLGGQVAGGRVAGNWPGLAQGNLLENRDLQPTTDLRSIAKGVLTAHFHLGPTALAQVFPDSADATPMAGLLRQQG